VNTAMPYHVVDSIAEALNQHKKSLKGAKLLVLGVAYKKDVDDLRESPTLKIMEILQKRGAEFEYNDPYFPQLHKMRHYDYSHMKSVPLSPEMLGKYDAVVIATDHSSYDYAAIVDAAKLVVDTRNATRRVIRNRQKIVAC
jgi:UDP-N-acetyl-D-glucosamine dehydrogenase